MDAVAKWIEQSPYAQMLGVAIDAITPDSARLVLPFAEGNTNPGQVLHGGVAVFNFVNHLRVPRQVVADH